MTEDQRNELVEKMIERLRKVWGDEFTDEDAQNIINFCNEEIVEGIPYPFPDEDIIYVSSQFELNYG
jgi:hypothetical protein